MAPDASSDPRIADGPIFEESQSSRAVYILTCILALAVTIGFFYYTFQFWVPAHPGTDQNGYLVGGKMIAQAGSPRVQPGDPFGFVGRMWIGNPDLTAFYPKYPAGLPLVYAGILKVAPAWMCFLLSPICATVSVLGMFLLVRPIFGNFAALVGMILLASSPVMLWCANNPNSHASSLARVIFGMLCLLRWHRQGGLFNAASAGLLLGYAVTIRYTEGVMLLPMLLVCGLRLCCDAQRGASDTPGKRFRQSAVMLACWALPVGLLIAFNLKAFGSVTGYDPTNESSVSFANFFDPDARAGFAFIHFQNNWETMLRGLSGTALVLVFPLAVAGLLALWSWNWRLASVVCGWAVPSVLVYTCYYWAPENGLGYMRFFLTIMPALLLAALSWITVGKSFSRRPNMITAGTGGVVALALLLNAQAGETTLAGEQRGSAQVAETARQLATVVPAQAVVFGDERTLNFLQFATDYQLYSGELFSRQAIQRLADVDPDAAQGLQPQRAKAIHDLLKSASDADLVRRQNDIVRQAWQQGHRTFIVGQKRVIDPLRRRFFNPREFEVKQVGSWDESEPARPNAPRWRSPRLRPGQREPQRFQTMVIYEITAKVPAPKIAATKPATTRTTTAPATQPVGR